MKSYEKMKKAITGILAVASLVMNTFVVVVAETEDDFVSKIKIIGNYVSFSGKSELGNADIEVFLLNEGKTVADLNAANTTEKFKATVNYCNELTADMNGNYSECFEMNNLDADKQYLLYVKSDTESYTKYIEKVKRIYVSTKGSNSKGDGSKENPFATIDYARDYIRDIEKNLPIEVIIEGGVYNVSSAIIFGSQDSGTKDAPITYKAVENSKVVFEGTTNIDISKITGVTDTEIMSRLQDGVADKLVQIDLAEQGIPEKIVNFLSSHNAGISGKAMGIYLNDKPQTISRWPNVGYEKILAGSTEGGSKSGETTDKGGAVIKISGLDKSRALRWANQDNMYVEGYLGNEWHGEWAKVKSVNPDDLTVTLDTYTHYGVSEGMRIAAVNLPEEIDVPGEWYADAKTMKLYYYPPYELTANDELEIATLCENFISINDGARYINVEGIEFAKNADSPEISLTNGHGGNGILLSGRASNINIKNCTLRNIGMDGIAAYASNVNIDGCVIYDTGFSGITVSNGDRNALTSGNVKISNCIITGISRDTGANGRAGIVVGGVGIVIENNILFNMPNSAIRYSGNNHIIRHNEIYNCVNETSDAGAIYSGRNWTEYGTTVKNNYFHNIGRGLTTEVASAIFWDDLHSGNSFVGNIVDMNNMVRTSGVKIGGGRDNTIKGNIFVNSAVGVMGQDRTVKPQTGVIFKEDNMEFYNGYAFQTFKEATIGVLNAYDITDGDWNEKYKIGFPTIIDNFNQLRYQKIYNRIESITDNAMYNCSTAINIDYNMENASTISNNKTVSVSDFVDAANGDYRIKNSSKTTLGLSAEVPDETFDMNIIGLQSEYTKISENLKFDLMYPANNGSISNTTTELKWSIAPFADYYIYEVATDSGFKNIVASGTTGYNVATVSGLAEDAEYFWRVTSVNISKELGSTNPCSDVFRFTTSGELLFEEIEYNNNDNVIEYTVDNTQKTEDDFTVIIALKTADGKLVAVRSEDKSIAAEKSEVFTTGTIFETELTDLNLEFYAWDSLGKMKNLTYKKVFKK